MAVNVARRRTGGPEVSPQDRARYVEKDMLLPEGKTCSECAHYRRCAAFISCPPDNVHCDWSPSRFRLAPAPYIQNGGGRG